ncbi:MAG: signal transduction histidine kinase/CheY-like chemotaxis protein [Desulforhopalus sp.]
MGRTGFPATRRTYANSVSQANFKLTTSSKVTTLNDNNPIEMQNKIVQLEKECGKMQQELASAEKQIHSLQKHTKATAALLQETNDKLRFFHEQKRLENLSKSDFLANMSHEIRTPLNIILGMAHLLAETPLTSAQHQYLNSLRVTGKQLMEILNNILEFSRIEAGKITFEPEPFSLQKIINQIEASALPLCLPKRLEFVVQHDPLLVMERVGDPLKIFQILLNLINNAVKFTKSGTITLSIGENDQQTDHLMLHVQDTGSGISKDQQKIIFDRFTQANESLSQQHRGAGLGLAISQKLTEAMGGHLTVDSRFGHGSTFTCCLPLPQVIASERPKLRLNTQLISPENFPELKVLAVDDIKENLEVLKVYLKDYPVDIFTANNGQEALETLEVTTFDLILMDIRMPVMDGITATKTIRKKEIGVGDPAIILAITAHAFQEQKNKFLKLGFDGVLTKPFFKRDLIQALFKYTSKHAVVLPPSEMGNKAIGYCLENEKTEDIPENLTELLPQIFQTIATDLQVIRKALTDQDYPVIYSTGHALTGVCGMFGFKRFATLITDLSSNVKAQNYTLANELVNSLDVYLLQLQQPVQNTTIFDSNTYVPDGGPLFSNQHRDDETL